jgi:intracellular multiplication protein IcmB
MGKRLGQFFNPFFAWFSTALKQTTISYCDIETADSKFDLVTSDGSLLSIIRLHGAQTLIGREEFDHINNQLQQSLQTTMSQPGHVLQVFFSYDPSLVEQDLEDILKPARATAERLSLDLDDLFDERIAHLSRFCAHEEAYLAVWTRIKTLTTHQLRQAQKDRVKAVKKDKVPNFIETQNPMAAIADLRESHDAFVRSVCSDFNMAGLVSDLLEVHDALRAVRMSVDPAFTDESWSPVLPGDKIIAKLPKKMRGDVSDLLWPSLKRQMFPRDAINHGLRVAQVGDRIYSSVYIDLFPREIQHFVRLFSRTLQAKMPWRISFLVESDGISDTRFRSILASILGFSSRQNRLITNSALV